MTSTPKKKKTKIKKNTCENCGTSMSVVWYAGTARISDESLEEGRLCLSCYRYWKTHQRPRPLSAHLVLSKKPWNKAQLEQSILETHSFSNSKFHWQNMLVLLDSQLLVGHYECCATIVSAMLQHWHMASLGSRFPAILSAAFLVLRKLGEVRSSVRFYRQAVQATSALQNIHNVVEMLLFQLHAMSPQNAWDELSTYLPVQRFRYNAQIHYVAALLGNQLSQEFTDDIKRGALTELVRVHARKCCDLAPGNDMAGHFLAQCLLESRLERDSKAVVQQLAAFRHEYAFAPSCFRRRYELETHFLTLNPEETEDLLDDLFTSDAASTYTVSEYLRLHSTGQLSNKRALLVVLGEHLDICEGTLAVWQQAALHFVEMRPLPKIWRSEHDWWRHTHFCAKALPQEITLIHVCKAIVAHALFNGPNTYTQMVYASVSATPPLPFPSHVSRQSISTSSSSTAATVNAPHSTLRSLPTRATATVGTVAYSTTLCPSTSRDLRESDAAVLLRDVVEGGVVSGGVDLPVMDEDGSADEVRDESRRDEGMKCAGGRDESEVDEACLVEGSVERAKSHEDKSCHAHQLEEYGEERNAKSYYQVNNEKNNEKRNKRRREENGNGRKDKRPRQLHCDG